MTRIRSRRRRDAATSRPVQAAVVLLLLVISMAAAAAPAPAGAPPDARGARAADGPDPQWREGRGENELVLIHGLGASAEIWRSVKPYLSGTYRVLLYELHGHGRTQPLPDGTIDGEVAAFGRWLQDQDLVYPHLVGHGLGGMIAMQYALNNPGQVQTLVVIDAGPRQLLDAPQKVAIAEALLKDYDRFVASHFIDISQQEPINQQAVDMALRTDSATFTSLLLSSFDWDVTASLPRQTMPLLVIGSETFMPEAGAEGDYLTAYGYSGARLLDYKRFEGTGHYLMLENPTRLAAHLLVWLRGQRH